MFPNFNKFIYSSKGNFPAAECTIPNPKERDVFEAETIYQVLWIDIRFPNEKMIDYATPYVYKDEDGTPLYGWTSVHSSAIYGNVENSCQFYDEFVVGFILTDEKYREEDREWFETFKRTIDKQCE